MTRTPVGSLPGRAAFEAAIEGSVVFPGSPGYELVRKPTWAQYEDVRPAAVALCGTPPDVAETIRFARRVGRGNGRAERRALLRRSLVDPRNPDRPQSDELRVRQRRYRNSRRRGAAR
jgi:hypothetical protein